MHNTLVSCSKNLLTLTCDVKGIVIIGEGAIGIVQAVYIGITKIDMELL